MYAIIKVNDDDIQILPKAPKDTKRIFKFPLGKTLRVDLDEGKVEGLKEYKPEGMKEKLMGAKTSLTKIYVNGQIVEEYPAVYITLAKSLDELKKSIVKEEEEDIMEEFTEARDNKNKIIQDGGAKKMNKYSKGAGYMYRKKGGANIMAIANIDSKALKAIDKAKKLKDLKGGSNCGSHHGGADFKKLQKSVLETTKGIYNISKGTVNKGMKEINSLAKKAYKYMKGGNYKQAKKELKKIQKQSKSMKKYYKGGAQCGGSSCYKGGSSCKVCKYAKK